MRALLLAFTFLVAMPALAQDTTAYAWPTPPGWSKERFALPPAFAPSVKYKGLEELRFSPNWGKKDSADSWAYCFAWVIAGKPLLTRDTLMKHLAAYYDGLYKANTQIAPLRPSRCILNIKKGPKGGPLVVQGNVTSFDYRTKKPLLLIVRATVRRHGAKTLVLVEAAPRLLNHPVWQKLDATTAAFRFAAAGK